ncbi:MAG: bifunctional serine/threonine-protein kinase/formylglycine-generating enzyme family protein [Planctomycetota bacterium]
MQVACPHCEAPLDVSTKTGRLKCGECANEFRVSTTQAIACPGCGSVLAAPEGAHAVLCGSCRERIELSAPPEPESTPLTPARSIPADEPSEEAEAHEETSVILAPSGQDDHLEGMRAEFADQYEIIESIGHGGMGAIYKAKQKKPPRVVVLKVMLNGRLASRKYRLRFEREAQAVARLKHPGIVSVYEYGEVNGQPYFTMEYVEGCNVREYVLRHDLDKRQTCKLFVKICKAVAYAHQRGVIHRDIKPNNILVDGEGNPRLLDFGLASLAGDYAEESPQMSEAGEVMGTPSYMSPEQTLGRPDEIDIRSDVYSLGVLFYELLTDSLPYRIDRTRPLESLRIIRDYLPKRPSALNPKLDTDLDSIVMRCLEKERDLRYQSAVELGEDIARYLRGQPVEARPSTTFYHFRKLLWRHRSFVMPFCALALALLVLCGVFVWRLAAAEARAQQKVQEAMRSAFDARRQRKELLGFLLEIQDVRAHVRALMAEGDWEGAHRVATFAEENLPPESGVTGLGDDVRVRIEAGAAEEVERIGELVEGLRFQEARDRVQRLRGLAERLGLSELAEQMGQVAEGFDDACAERIFSYIQQNKASVRALVRFLAECPGNPHAQKARRMLDALIGNIRFTGWPFGPEEARRNQRKTAEVLELPVEHEVEVPGDGTVRFVLVPAGEFMMGASGEGKGFNADQEPEHPVRIMSPFYVSATEVTRGQFEAVTARVLDSERRGSGFADLPAAVSWEDARLFCQKLSQRSKDRLTFRLPTEAEWEYACRAGSAELYAFGNDAGPPRLGSHAWYRANAQGAARPVGAKEPNVWGLHDMHGNMQEWCADWYEARYYLSSPVQNPPGPEGGTYKVLRGGSWADGSEELRSAHRKAVLPQSSRPTYGFRVCFDVFSPRGDSPIAGPTIPLLRP